MRHGFKVLDKRTGEELSAINFYIDNKGLLRYDKCRPSEAKVYDMHSTPDNLIAVSAIDKVDSMGEQIYEGDVVRDDNGAIYTVKWIKAQYRFMLVITSLGTFAINSRGNLTIVGNIYQPAYRADKPTEHNPIPFDHDEVDKFMKKATTIPPERLNQKITSSSKEATQSTEVKE